MTKLITKFAAILFAMFAVVANVGAQTHVVDFQSVMDTKPHSEVMTYPDGYMYLRHRTWVVEITRHDIVLVTETCMSTSRNPGRICNQPQLVQIGTKNDPRKVN